MQIGLGQLYWLIDNLIDTEVLQEIFDTSDRDAWFECLKAITPKQKARFWSLIFQKRFDLIKDMLDQFGIPRKKVASDVPF